jgi:hypothetical protein
MKNIRFTSLLLLILVFVSDVNAQLKRRVIKHYNPVYRKGHKSLIRVNTYTAIGLSAKALNYYGDLAPFPSKFSTDISFTKPGVGVSFIHRYGPRYTVVGEFLYGQIEGSDATSARSSDPGGYNFRKERNLSFRNQIKELSVLFVFDLFENKSTFLNRVKWTPYIFFGGSVFAHNPQAKAPATYLDGVPDPKAGQWVDLQPLGTEGQYSTLKPGDVNYGVKPYSLVQVAVPFGLGARIRLNDYFDLWADVGIRYTFTDYLDDVSKNYVDLNRIKDPLAQALSYRSNEISNPGLPTHPEQITVYDQPLPDPANPGAPAYNGKYGHVVTVPMVDGYGSEYPTNNRGNSKRNDVYTVTSIRLSYIFSRLNNAKKR